MAAKKDMIDAVADEMDVQLLVNPLLTSLSENDKKNLFKTNVNTAFIKTGFPLIDYYFGSVINIYDESGNIIRQEGRIGQAAGTFNLVIAATGGGKAQPISAKIPTPDGYKLMGDIKVGDKVFGRDGSQVNVIGVYPQGIKDVYEITFSDKRKARCCKDHLWEVLTETHSGDKIQVLSLEDIMKDYKSYSEHLHEYNQAVGSNRDDYLYRYRIPTITAPVEYDHHDTPIDPYILGVFIGNGCLKEDLLSISSPDSTIPQYIAKRYGFELYKYSQKNYTYTFKDPDTDSNILTRDFFEDLQEMIGVISSEKSIPDIYLYNDYETRVNLLRGLMDTDGSIEYGNGRDRVTYSSCSETLLKQIQQLIRSIGFNGSIYIDSRTHKYRNGYCGTVRFSVPNDFKPEMFLLSHKSVLVSDCVGISSRRHFDYIWIKDIQKVGEEECQCIMVDSRDHLYVTEDFIVTHNTTLVIQIIGNMLRQFAMANGILFDCEERTDIPRCQNITKLPSGYFYSDSGTPRFLIRQGAIGLDSIQEMIVKLYVKKMQYKNQMMVSAGHTDGFGKDVMFLPPTIICIDSITTVLSETFNPDNTKEASNAEKMRGNTEGARDAKTLKGFFKDILPLCHEADILVYGINHINQNMSMNAFTPVAKQQNFLKQDESIPGGKTMLYYPYNIIKLTAKPSDDFTEETDGFAGHIVMFEPIKSSSNQSGNDKKGLSFEMVFSFKEGFDTLRTMVWYGKTYGFIEGNKARMRFKGDDSFTFSWKDLPKEAKTKPIWDNLRKYVYPHLDTHLSYIELDNHQFDDNVLMY